MGPTNVIPCQFVSAGCAGLSIYSILVNLLRSDIVAEIIHHEKHLSLLSSFIATETVLTRKREGTYHPPSPFPNDNVTKAKLRFLINAPGDPRFARCEEDYDRFIGNLKMIHDEDMRPGRQPEGVIRPIGANNDVRVLHSLVVVCYFAPLPL